MTTEFLKECMADALIKLLEVKPIEKITVQEIVACSGVGRTTWFRSFASKREALIFKLEKLWIQWTVKHHLLEWDWEKELVEGLIVYYDCFYQNKDLFLTLYAGGLSGVVFEACNHVMYENRKGGESESYQARFYSGAIFGVIDEWIRSRFRETPQELAVKTAPLFIESPHSKTKGMYSLDREYFTANQKGYNP